MIRSCLSALLSHWRRNPVQLFAYIAGLALATALWSGVQAINSEARASYQAAAATLGEGQNDLLFPKHGDHIPQETYVLLRRSGWLVSPIVSGRLNDVRLIGIDLVTSATGLASGGEALESTFIGSDRLLANEETALRLGSSLDITVDASIASGIAIGDIGFVQQLLGRDYLSHLVLLPDQPIGQPALDTIAPNLRLQSAQ